MSGDPGERAIIGTAAQFVYSSLKETDHPDQPTTSVDIGTVQWHLGDAAVAIMEAAGVAPSQVVDRVNEFLSGAEGRISAVFEVADIPDGWERPIPSENEYWHYGYQHDAVVTAEDDGTWSWEVYEPADEDDDEAAEAPAIHSGIADSREEAMRQADQHM